MKCPQYHYAIRLEDKKLSQGLDIVNGVIFPRDGSNGGIATENAQSQD